MPIRIFAVVVLYRMRAEESAAFCSLAELVGADVGVGAVVEWMVCDNSPHEQAAPEGFEGEYLRDGTNAGLARCYNEALRRAEAGGFEWLMLLDQDTTVTAAYLREVLEVAGLGLGDDRVVAMVPRLVEAGVVCSPAYPPRYGPARAIGAGECGAAKERLHAFNSGAVVRVRALREIGGFAEEFPLDYLDHATFTQLQTRGGRLFVLRSELEHELSSNDETRRDDAAERRRAGVLDAEYRFYARYGSVTERLLRRFRLLRAALGRVVRGKDAAQTRRMLRSAIRP